MFSVIGTLSSLFSIAKSGVKLVTERPVHTLAALAIVAGSYFAYNFAYDRGVASTVEEMDELKERLKDQIDLVNARNTKIAALETAVAVQVTNNKEAMTALNAQLGSIVESYSRNLRIAALSKSVETRTITVSVPNTTKTAEVQFQDGNIVCDRYPAGYVSTVNDAVSKTVATMRGESK